MAGDPLAVLLIPESMSEIPGDFDDGLLDMQLLPDFDSSALDLAGMGDAGGHAMDVKREIMELWKEYRESNARLGRKIRRVMEMVYKQG